MLRRLTVMLDFDPGADPHLTDAYIKNITTDPRVAVAVRAACIRAMYREDSRVVAIMPSDMAEAFMEGSNEALKQLGHPPVFPHPGYKAPADR